MPTLQEQEYINGLLAERAGYLQARKKDRAALVDAELARVGYREPGKERPEETETATADPVEERATVKPRGRPRRAR
jgi:hypothetical protein